MSECSLVPDTWEKPTMNTYDDIFISFTFGL